MNVAPVSVDEAHCLKCDIVPPVGRNLIFPGAASLRLIDKAALDLMNADPYQNLFDYLHT